MLFGVTADVERIADSDSVTVDVVIGEQAAAMFLVGGDPVQRHQVTFHGLRVGAEMNVGARSPAGGTPVPAGHFREVLVELAAWPS